MDRNIERTLRTARFRQKRITQRDTIAAADGREVGSEIVDVVQAIEVQVLDIDTGRKPGFIPGYAAKLGSSSEAIVAGGCVVWISSGVG